MISYVSVGADDIPSAKRFYQAFMPALGYGLKEGPEGLSYVLPPGTVPGVELPEFYVKPPYDGQAAAAGNGSMVAFELRDQAQVRELHAAALAAGGTRVVVPQASRALLSDPACLRVSHIHQVWDALGWPTPTPWPVGRAA